MKKIKDPNNNVFLWIDVENERYKYQMINDYKLKLNFKPEKTIIADFFAFDSNGFLSIRDGYMWDGASGPTLDTISTMRASCVHDVGYQMIRTAKIDPSYKKSFDKELSRIMKEDYNPSWFGGSLWSKFRAGYYYQAVSLFGGSSCVPGSEK